MFQLSLLLYSCSTAVFLSFLFSCSNNIGERELKYLIQVTQERSLIFGWLLCVKNKWREVKTLRTSTRNSLKEEE